MVKMNRIKTVALIGTCPRCGESVEMYVSKRQLKALLKGFKAGSPSEAEKLAESLIGRDRNGEMKL